MSLDKIRLRKFKVFQWDVWDMIGMGFSACSQNIPRFPEKYLSHISRLILEISSLTSKVMPDRLCLSNLTLILTLTF